MPRCQPHESIRCSFSRSGRSRHSDNDTSTRRWQALPRKMRAKFSRSVLGALFHYCVRVDSTLPAREPVCRCLVPPTTLLIERPMPTLAPAAACRWCARNIWRLRDSCSTPAHAPPRWPAATPFLWTSRSARRCRYRTGRWPSSLRARREWIGGGHGLGLKLPDDVATGTPANAAFEADELPD